MTLRKVLLAPVAVTLVAASLMTGCSDNYTSGTSTATATPNVSASAQESQASLMRAVAVCLRANGYPNFPDPVQDKNGNWGFPQSGQIRMGKVPPCEALGRRAKAQSRPEDRDRATPAELANLRRYSACIRQNGVTDWPDPTNAGTFKLPDRLQTPAGEALLRAPDRACLSLLKGTEVQIEKSGGGS
jgi:hypothetical protein